MSKKGWTAEESALLEELARSARGSGGSLSEVFRTVAERTGRMPNSVRNRYYSRAREEGRKTAEVRRFSAEETDALVLSMLERMGSGSSLRAAALELAKGDAGLMLRYQNKFRSLMLKKPALIREIAQKHGLSPVPAKRERKQGSAEELEMLRGLVSEQAEELARRHERILLLTSGYERLCALTEQLIACMRGGMPVDAGADALLDAAKKPAGNK